MMAFILSNPDGVARGPGTYSLAAEIAPGARRLILSGQVGTAADGTVPADGEAQIANIYRNIGIILAAHGMTLEHVARQTVLLTDRALLPSYRVVRERIMGDHKPASTLMIVAGLADPAFLAEIDVEAFAV